LELHLETFSLSVQQVGLCFLTMAVPYTIVTIVAGYCADKFLHPGSITVSGFLLLLISFTLIGPVGWMPVDPQLGLTLAGLLLQGAGSGAVIVSTYSSCLRATLTIDGYSQSVTTFSLVSGLWTSAFALGNFVGPSFAGIIFEQIGFRWGTVIIQTMLLMMTTLNIFSRKRDKRTSRRIFNDQVYEEFKNIEVYES